MKILEMWGLKEKTNEDNKQTNETNNVKKEKKRYPPNTSRFSKSFSHAVYLFLS